MTDATILESLTQIASSEDPKQARETLDTFRSAGADYLAEYLPLISVIETKLEEILHLQELAGTDALTGIANRRAFNDALERQMALYQRHQIYFSIVLLDLDDLKQLNDLHGHGAGDRAIITVARLCSATLRGTDLAARLGGDEFAVLLPDADQGRAQAVARRLRSAIESESVAGQSLRVSVGVATVSHKTVKAESLVLVADRQLYADKGIRKPSLAPLHVAETHVPRSWHVEEDSIDLPPPIPTRVAISTG